MKPLHFDSLPLSLLDWWGPRMDSDGRLWNSERFQQVAPRASPYRRINDGNGWKMMEMRGNYITEGLPGLMINMINIDQPHLNILNGTASTLMTDVHRVHPTRLLHSPHSLLHLSDAIRYLSPTWLPKSPLVLSPFPAARSPVASAARQASWFEHDCS